MIHSFLFLFFFFTTRRQKDNTAYKNKIDHENFFFIFVHSLFSYLCVLTIIIIIDEGVVYNVIKKPLSHFNNFIIAGEERSGSIDMHEMYDNCFNTLNIYYPLE